MSEQPSTRIVLPVSSVSDPAISDDELHVRIFATDLEYDLRQAR